MDEKIDENAVKRNRIRNTAIGAGAGYIAGHSLEDTVRNHPKKTLYTAIGAGIGYLIAKVIENGGFKKATDYAKQKMGYVPKNTGQQ